MTSNWAKLYFAVSTILSFVAILYYQNLLALEFALQDNERHLLAILVSFSCPLVIAAQFYAFLQLLEKQISAAETTVRKQSTFCLGVVFFLFWIGIIWFLNGQDPLSAAVFRMTYLNYGIIALHVSIGFYFFGFFKDLNSRPNAKKTKSQTFNNYVWILWFLAIFHLISLYKFRFTLDEVACGKVFGTSGIEWLSNRQQYFESRDCSYQFEYAEQVFENLLMLKRFAKTDLFGVDVIIYCASFLIGISLRYLMTSLSIFGQTKENKWK